MALAFLTCALAAGATAARAEEVTYYVPFVRVLTATLPGDAGKPPSYVYWASTLSAYNNSATPARISYGSLFGNGIYGPFPCCCDGVIDPFSGIQMETKTGGCVGLIGGGGAGFLVLTAESSVVLSADVQRIIWVAGCGGGAGPPEDTGRYNVVSQGTSPLPVYKGMMAGNSTVVAGPVDLGAIDHPETCITGPLTHRRRVNVTLFNGGNVDADFTVVGRRPRQRADPIFQIPVVLKPQEVRQLNSIPITVSDDLQFIDGYDVRIWLSITATQPFLTYVTTIFEGGEPGTNAVTVYEARPSN